MGKGEKRDMVVQSILAGLDAGNRKKEIVRLCILLKKQEKKGNGSWEIFYVELGEMSGSRERIMKYSKINEYTHNLCLISIIIVIKWQKLPKTFVQNR